VALSHLFLFSNNLKIQLASSFFMQEFRDFKKILELYKLKQVPRSCSNTYFDEKDGVNYTRKETTAEHVYSALKLADYFFINETEFFQVDKLRVYDLLLYHDDVEIVTRDINISEREARKDKDQQEQEALPLLAGKLPNNIGAKLLECDTEFRENRTNEAKFAHAIDKLDALVHELQYPKDWGPKGFDEKNVRAWFQPSFMYSPTFSSYFESIVDYLNKNDYFKYSQ
jgi:putative hydrolase of HD superfamily